MNKNEKKFSTVHKALKKDVLPIYGLLKHPLLTHSCMSTNLWTKLKAISLWTKLKIISPLCIRHKKKTFYQSMVFWNMRCWLTRACRRMGWTWLENLSSGRPEGRGAALTLVVRYYYLACTYIRSPILRSCCRQARLPYTPPINRWLAQSKNWLSSNLSINFEIQGQNGQMSCQRDVIT